MKLALNLFAALAAASLTAHGWYTAAYAAPGRMRAQWAYFVSFIQAANDFAQLAQTKLSMPVLAIGGEKSLEMCWANR